jgi:hypothetical protein
VGGWERERGGRVRDRGKTKRGGMEKREGGNGRERGAEW